MLNPEEGPINVQEMVEYLATLGAEAVSGGGGGAEEGEDINQSPITFHNFYLASGNAGRIYGKIWHTVGTGNTAEIVRR
jgi:hypothetical protein